MRVVLDTVVFVRSLISPGGACGEALFAYAARFRLFVSQPLVLEYMEVLARPELKRKFRTLAERSPRRLLALLAQAEVVTAAQGAAVSRDPNDDKFLDAAGACGAEFLVSEDRDLLGLQQHGDTRIVTCLEFLQILRERFGRVE